MKLATCGAEETEAERSGRKRIGERMASENRIGWSCADCGEKAERALGRATSGDRKRSESEADGRAAAKARDTRSGD